MDTVTEEKEPPPKPVRRRKPRAATPAGARETYRQAALRNGTGFTPDRQAQYLACLARGLRKSKAAEIVGVTYAAVKKYAAKDPGFAAAEAEAEAQACEAVEDALWETALAGHMTAMMFWLQNRAPGRWQDMRRVAKTITHEGTVVHELDAAPVIERIALLQARLTERKELRQGGEDVIDVAEEA